MLLTPIASIFLMFWNSELWNIIWHGSEASWNKSRQQFTVSTTTGICLDRGTERQLKSRTSAEVTLTAKKYESFKVEHPLIETNCGRYSMCSSSLPKKRVKENNQGKL